MAHNIKNNEITLLLKLENTSVINFITIAVHKNTCKTELLTTGNTSDIRLLLKCDTLSNMVYI